MPTSESSTAFIGLGAMGQGMALNLLSALQAGVPNFDSSLLVLDQDPRRMQPLLQAGALAATGPDDIAARCDTVFLCLPEAAPVQQVLFGATGTDSRGGLAHCAQEAGKSQTYIDTTTLQRQSCLLYTSPSPRDGLLSRMPSSA